VSQFEFLLCADSVEKGTGYLDQFVALNRVILARRWETGRFMPV
jgi:hypothetical protein